MRWLLEETVPSRRAAYSRKECVASERTVDEVRSPGVFADAPRLRIQDFSNFPQERRRGERLVEKRHVCLQHAVSHDGVVRVA